MTPVLIAPPELPSRPPAASSAIAIQQDRPAVAAATISANVFVPSDALEDAVTVGDPNFPEGIDYERWSRVVRPSPRAAFADRLDLLELFED